MTARERVMTALNHKEPDSVPIDFGGHRSSGIAAIAYAKLRKFLDLPQKPIRVYDVIQQLAIVDDDVLDYFGIDTIELGRGFANEASDWKAWQLPDGTACQIPAWANLERAKEAWIIHAPDGIEIARMPDGAQYFEQSYWPLADEEKQISLGDIFEDAMWTSPQLASPPGPLVSGADGAAKFEEGAKQLRQKTDRAIIGLFGGNLLEIGQFLYRNDNFFMLLAGEPAKAHAFLDKLTEFHLNNLEKYYSSGSSGCAIKFR